MQLIEFGTLRLLIVGRAYNYAFFVNPAKIIRIERYVVPGGKSLPRKPAFQILTFTLI